MELQGYAYILTHPGTPAVFYDHIFSHLQPEIAKFISIRHRQKIHCRSKVKSKIQLNNRALPPCALFSCILMLGLFAM